MRTHGKRKVFFPRPNSTPPAATLHGVRSGACALSLLRLARTIYVVLLLLSLQFLLYASAQASPLKRYASASTLLAGGMTSPSQQKKLWDSRFVSEGSVWGMMPCAQMHLSCDFLTFRAGDQGSNTAQRLLPLLPPCASVFECGFGYGRDVIFLAKAGFTVYGIDPSEVGVPPLMTSKSSLLCVCVLSLCAYHAASNCPCTCRTRKGLRFSRPGICIGSKSRSAAQHSLC